ncbi:MAG: peptidase domain-containing ABC transporter [Cytophagales bacterium]|nr:MAG: peptidase domain-containing ABC transporter [Cytophagales bacterium]
MLNFFKRNKPPYFRQLDQMDCGPTCLKMVSKYHGRDFPIQYLRDNCFIDRQGVSIRGLSDAAEKIGMRTMAVKASFDLLKNEAPLPCIAYWQQKHFVVIYDIIEGNGKKPTTIVVGDPATSLLTYTENEFVKYWLEGTQSMEQEGFVLLLEPTPDFYKEDPLIVENKADYKFFLRYLIPFRRYIIQLLIGLFTGSLLTLIIPFLTQALVDFGINHQDLGFVYVILIAQIMLFIGKTSLEILRSWILMHVASRVNIYIVSDFLMKLMRLPISFFEARNMGDILQRIHDHEKIKKFLTSSSLDIAFSLFNLIIFAGILLFYSVTIFLIFIVFSIVYVTWVINFLEKRKNLNYKSFNQLSANQSNEVQLITGMQEIKLNNTEKQKRWEWEKIQIQLFKIDIQGLRLRHYQNVGAAFINELKNIIISFVAAKQVIDGSLTLGMMLSVTYILGQLNSVLALFINFAGEAQDAKISLERSGEIHSREEEEEGNLDGTAFILPENKDIIFHNLHFRYGNPHSDYILDKINLTIPYGKTTAIVGASGSGKTTLLKMLLKFYQAEIGEVRLGGMPLDQINTQLWRSKCGVVMQDGFIFSDTVARNIALSEENINKEKLFFAAEVANIKDFVESLPLNYNTKIGNEGLGLSQGQKQRILIARAVYKNPDFIFLDEATSALDANNEKEITEKLDDYCMGKTVVVIAHRLSTVKNAHQILVLNKGKIAEIGSHEELTKKRGLYYQLVKNQLELGS